MASCEDGLGVMFDLNVAVVIPAAGKSVRFLGNNPKQYSEVLGKPLLMYCVEAFLKIGYIKRICIVSDRVEYVQRLFDGKQDRIVVVAGGQSRHLSIKNGLDALQNSDINCRVVVVHDGARPLVPQQLLMDLIVAAGQHRAAGATVPLTSTVLRPDRHGFVDLCLDRAAHVASETPQAFDFQTLCNAYQEASDDDLEHGTECLALILKYCGVRGKLIPGPPNCLWKVTEKKDYHASVACIKENSTRVYILLKDVSQKNTALRLQAALAGKVAETFVLNLETARATTTHDVTVIFHAADKEENFLTIHKDWHLTKMFDCLDKESQGLVIQVMRVERNHSMPECLDTFLEFGEKLRNGCKNGKKGAVMIYVTVDDVEERLICLIKSLVLADYESFSGQVFFL